MKKVRVILALVLMLIPALSFAADSFVSFAKGDWQLNSGSKVSIYLCDKDERGVSIAVNNLRQDLLKVCGGNVTIVDNEAQAQIVVGTVGYVPAVKAYAKQLKGKAEQYIIDAKDGKLIIAGSDRRATIYGIYELSRQIGVSPWYYWADAPIVHHDAIYITNGSYTDGEPAVRWRGIFLNDEAPCLTTWVKNTFGTNYGGHEFYAKVFELILRLKGNMIWPAMWGWAFYADDPINSKTADEMGVIIGTSHHEPMARNHQEYARDRKGWGAWNYNTNKTNLDRFFREGIERMKGTDDIVTIGMRGDGDEAMSAEADTKLLENIVENQRRIIKEVTKRPAKETPQVWALYKEVQDYYDAGMRVPEDVCMLLCDDNWGDVRRVPNAKERMHKGGFGLYYHVDYVGAPRNSKWLNVTQTQQMMEQLNLAYDFGIEKMWILNVGDLKPMEYPIQLFLDMAWNPKEYNQQNVVRHTKNFFDELLGNACVSCNGDKSVCQMKNVPCETVGKIAALYNDNCRFAARVTAEMLDAQTYNVETGEWKQVADEYQRLELRALRLLMELPQECHDAYRQLVLFPIQAMANVYEMYYAQAMNRYLAKNNDPDANVWAARVKECFKRDSLLCLSYNKDIAGGKWDGMMIQKHIGYTSWNDNFPHEMLPKTTTVEAPEGASSASAAKYDGYVFSPSYNASTGAGYVSMEAEHFFSAKADANTEWSVYPYYGRTRSAVALTPYTQPTGDAALTYRFSLPANHPATVKVHIVVKSTLDFENRGGHEYTVSLDGSDAQTVNFNKNLVDRQPYMYSEFYPTIARRVVENVVELPVGNGDIHDLVIHPRHPGIVFEKIVVDFGGYSKSFLFGNESKVVRKAK